MQPLRLAALALTVASASIAAQAQPVGACDRACLAGLADQLLNAMAAHDPSHLPLGQTYRATENSIPAALGMMTAWRTVTGVKGRYYVIDPASHQLFLMASVAEGANDTFLYGRIKVAGRQLSEVELFENRSRGQGGFQYGAEGPANLPAEWTSPVGPERLPTRAALLAAGRAVFDDRLDSPPASPDCVLMENGKVVAEHPEVAQAVSDASQAHKAGKAFRPNPDGTIPIPCGAPKPRPTDPAARTEIVDELQGLVVSQGVVSGVVEPYLATSPTESAFVPDQILGPYAAMLEKQRAGPPHGPAVSAARATAAAAEVHRIYDGKLQGQMLLVNLGAPGGRSPWIGD